MGTLKASLLFCYKRAHSEKLMQGTSGNASVFDRENNRIYITPSGSDHALMEENDIVELNLNGTVLNGEKRPSSEWRMHLNIYKKASHCNAILHTHSPYATAFAAINCEIPNMLAEMNFWTDGSIPVSCYAPVGSTELADNVSEILQNRRTCLMQNHGAIATGESTTDAYMRATYIEDAARICYIAKTLKKSLSEG